MPDWTSEPMQDRIATVLEAKDRQVTVAFVYEDLKGIITRRVVDPARIEGVQMLGWCCHREDYRKFDFRRMHLVKIGPSPNSVHLPLGEPEELCR